MRLRIVCAVLLLVLAAAVSRAWGDDQWRLTFSDDFNRQAPGKDWYTTSGELSIVGGALEVRSSGVGLAILNRSCPADIKVTYTAWTPAGVERCDLTTILGCDPSGKSGGYFLGYGSWMDTMNHLLKDQETELDKTTSYLISQNEKKHKIEAVKEGGHAYLIVDGHKILESRDNDPCGGVGEDHIALYTWSSAMRIDDLKVYVKGQAPTPPTKDELALPITKDSTGRLVCPANQGSEALRHALDFYNSGRYDEARLAFDKLPDTFVKAAGLAWVTGQVDYFNDRQAVTDLLACLKHLPANARTATLTRMVRRLAVLAGAISGSRNHCFAKLLQDLPPDHPFYDKVLLYQARVYEWDYRESGDQKQKEKAESILKPLLAKYPGNRVIRIYLGETLPWPDHVTLDDRSAPDWARQLCETYLRSLAVIDWWGRNRQAADGSLGGNGGWGDDVELLCTWGHIAAISDGNEYVQDVVRRMCDGVWNSPDIRRTGFCTYRTDVQHAAEPSADTQPLMLLLRYGDPEYVERNMLTAKLCRDVLMGRNSHGHWHWRSNQLSSAGPSDNPKYAVDVPYACRAFKHVSWLAWYSRNPGAVRMVTDWARSWAEDAMRSGNGKPAGVVPAAVAFGDDNVSGTSPKWWEPDLGWGYYDWSGGSWMYDIFMQAYAYHPDDSLLAPIRAALDFPKVASPDTPDWVVQKMASEAPSAAGEAVWFYKELTGQDIPGFDVSRYANFYERFLQNGNREPVLKKIAEMRSGADQNLELLTSEVMATDRAGLWWSGNLLRLYCGAPRMWDDPRLPVLSVRWSLPTDKFAAVVTRSEPDELQAVLYNFEKNPVKAEAACFRLKSGVYELTLGPDANDDWQMDSVEQTCSVAVRQRGDRIAFELPSRRVVILRLRLKSPLKQFSGPLPDLGISNRDIVRKGNRLEVKIHNIGGADAGAFKVSAIDLSTKKILAKASVPGIPCPADLVPKVRKIVLRVPAKQSNIKVTIGYPGREITTTNNTAYAP